MRVIILRSILKKSEILKEDLQRRRCASLKHTHTHTLKMSALCETRAGRATSDLRPASPGHMNVIKNTSKL